MGIELPPFQTIQVVAKETPFLGAAFFLVKNEMYINFYRPEQHEFQNSRRFNKDLWTSEIQRNKSKFKENLGI